MRVTPNDRINIRLTMADTRRDDRFVWVLIPTVTQETFDRDTQSGMNISTGDGTGQKATWSISRFLAHIRQVNQYLRTYGNIPPGVEVGDSIMYINTRDKAMIDKAINNENAYLYLDGKPWRPFSTNVSGLGEIEEWVVSFRQFTPVFRAPGY